MRAQTCNYQIEVMLMASWGEWNALIDSIRILEQKKQAPANLTFLKEQIQNAMLRFPSEFSWRVAGATDKE